jgi:hypothetical protein
MKAAQKFLQGFLEGVLKNIKSAARIAQPHRLHRPVSDSDAKEMSLNETKEALRSVDLKTTQGNKPELIRRALDSTERVDLDSEAKVSDGADAGAQSVEVEPVNSARDDAIEFFCLNGAEELIGKVVGTELWNDEGNNELLCMMPDSEEERPQLAEYVARFIYESIAKPFDLTNLMDQETAKKMLEMLDVPEAAYDFCSSQVSRLMAKLIHSASTDSSGKWGRMHPDIRTFLGGFCERCCASTQKAIELSKEPHKNTKYHGAFTPGAILHPYNPAKGLFVNTNELGTSVREMPATNVQTGDKGEQDDEGITGEDGLCQKVMKIFVNSFFT